MKGKVKKSLLVLAVATALLMIPFESSAESSGLENFTKLKTYGYQFQDVKSSDWYFTNVKNAYEMGLMNGSSETSFNVKGNVTIAEVVTIAARLHNIHYNGSDKFEPTSPWYQTYVDYAQSNGILISSYSDYGRKATRAEFAQILAKAFPESALTEKNTVEDGVIPDVSTEASYADEVYLLYRAGVLTGNDSRGYFAPDSNIQRSAVAAIVTRMADVELRQSITLESVSSLTMNQSTATMVEGGFVVLFADMATLTGEDAKLTWASSDSNIATVVDGKVTGIKGGTTIITATAPNGKEATCKVTVTIEAKSIKLNKTTQDLYIGKTDRLNLTISPADTTDQNVSWTSSDPSVIRVDKDGKVTGYGRGTAIITAKTANGLTASCVYYVTKLYTVDISRSKVTVLAGDIKSVTVAHNSELPVSFKYSIDDTSIVSCGWDWDTYGLSSSSDLTYTSEKLNITGEKAGTTYITISYYAEGKTISDTIRVTVEPPYSIVMPPLPAYINYIIGTSYRSTFNITGVKYVEDSFYSFGSYGTLYFTGFKSADAYGENGTSSVYWRWELLDSSGNRVDSGYCSAFGVRVGDTITKEVSVYGLEKGTYQLILSEY